MKGTRKFTNRKVIASVALLFASFLGGIMPIASKILMREISVYSALFWSMTLMLLVYSPVIVSSRKVIQTHIRPLVIIALLWSANVAFFMIAITRVSSVFSQIMYAMVPVYVLLLERFYFRNIEHTTLVQKIGIISGFAGVVIISNISTDGIVSLDAFGSGLLVIGAVFWALYIVLSKKISSHVTPLQITASLALFGWIFLGIFCFILVGKNVIDGIMLSWNGVMALLYIGVVVRGGMMFLSSWGIVHGSPFMAASTTYVSTFISGVFGFIVLNETITGRFLFGAVFLLLGMFCTVTYPILRAVIRREI